MALDTSNLRGILSAEAMTEIFAIWIYQGDYLFHVGSDPACISYQFKVMRDCFEHLASMRPNYHCESLIIYFAKHLS